MATRRRVLAAVAASPLAVACGTGASNTATGGEAPAGKLKTGSTLNYWNDMGGAYPGVMQTWADRFAQKTGVKVEATGGIGDYNNKLGASFASGSSPDIYRYLYSSIPLPAAVERGMLMKLDAYVKRDKYDLSDFRKDALELYRWKGDLLALPRDYGLQLIFYNTDIFQREGLQPIPADWNDKTWTLQKFLEYCQRLTRPGGTGMRSSSRAATGCGGRSSTARRGGREEEPGRPGHGDRARREASDRGAPVHAGPHLQAQGGAAPVGREHPG